MVLVRNWQKFFEPQSVVIIGASSTPHKPGNDVIKNILENEYEGKVYLVNPKGGSILGEKVYPNIQDLPEEIDLAIIILAAKNNLRALRDCVAKGIKHFVLPAGGFSEVDENGQILQDELSKFVSETGIELIGPNTSGHTSTPHNFTSSFFPLGKIPKGTVSYLNQTGNFATHTMRYIMTAEHFGVARVVGLGNKLDLEESEVLEYLGQDSHTSAILMYMENIKNIKRFIKVAKKVTKIKPIIMLKGGMTFEGKKAAMAHTASLASDDKIVDGALRQAGVVRIHKYSHLLWTAKALSYMPLPQGNRVSILAPSGAMLVVMTDLCHHSLGLDVPELNPATVARLQEISPPFIRMRNPVDIWASVTQHGVKYAYREGMEAVLKDRNVDAVVSVLMLAKETGVPPLDFIVELAGKYPSKPIYVTFSGDKKYMDEAKAFLEPKGIPTFPMIEEPLETLSILSRCRKAMLRE